MSSHATDQSANLKKGISFCKKSKELGCDIVLFPEMWNVGYYAICPNEVMNYIDDFKRRSIPEDSSFVREYQALAKKLEIIIVTTYLEAPSSEEPPKGIMIVINRKGHIVLKYAKVHTCDFDMGVIYEPGNEFPVASVDTIFGPVVIGGMLCYDREFPESARILMLKGAEIILTANCCTLDDKRINQFQTRAFENAVGVAMTNYPMPFTNGRSVAFDAQGEQIVQAGSNEGIYIARFDIDELRLYRSTCGWGNSYRRPRKYSLLTSSDVQSPFLRNNALGKPFNRNDR